MIFINNVRVISQTLWIKTKTVIATHVKNLERIESKPLWIKTKIIVEMAMFIILLRVRSKPLWIKTKLIIEIAMFLYPYARQIKVALNQTKNVPIWSSNFYKDLCASDQSRSKSKQNLTEIAMFINFVRTFLTIFGPYSAFICLSLSFWSFASSNYKTFVQINILCFHTDTKHAK